MKSLIHGQSLADIANWADEQRVIPESAPWHYVDVPITQQRYDPKYCPPAGCVVSKIEEFRRVLMRPSAARTQKQYTLMFLVHFVADLHQPLHVGDTHSRGGNAIQVRFFDIGSNLHKVWDTEIVEWHTRDEGTWLRELIELATPENVSEWSRGTVEDWATESLAQAKLAYRWPGRSDLIQPGATLTREYCRASLLVIQRQLAQAGIRLAYILNELFK